MGTMKITIRCPDCLRALYNRRIITSCNKIKTPSLTSKKLKGQKIAPILVNILTNPAFCKYYKALLDLGIILFFNNP